MRWILLILASISCRLVLLLLGCGRRVVCRLHGLDCGRSAPPRLYLPLLLLGLASCLLPHAVLAAVGGAAAYVRMRPSTDINSSLRGSRRCPVWLGRATFGGLSTAIGRSVAVRRLGNRYASCSRFRSTADAAEFLMDDAIVDEVELLFAVLASVDWRSLI